MGSLTQDDLVLPNVILWDPMQQHATYFSQVMCCPESGCGQNLSLFRWNTGSSSGHCPRIIHDIQHLILLVAAVYQCANGHEILSTDPQILALFIEQEHVPFILFHRSGISRGFCRMVIQLALQGMGFTAIEHFIITQRMEEVASMKLQISSLEGRVPNLHSADNFISHIDKPYPSNDLLCKCFLQDFLEHKVHYFHEMSQLTTSGYISLDHTFKVAANLGYVRPDGRWVSQYEAALIVLNNLGQIITWQLTRTTSLDETLPMLTKLNERLAKSHARPKIICVDNCCTVRGKLQAIFGSDTFICLDLFHAVQRIIKSMPKKHPMFFHCKRDVSMIFRDPMDRGSKRKMVTPDCNTMLKNFEDFVKKWKGVEFKGSNIMNNNVSNALNHLRVHILKGCLSGIPPGCGTNKNENLHKLINPFFSRCRIGIPLALALLTVLFHRHNQKVSGLQQLPILHARALKSTCNTSNEHFGIVDKDSEKTGWIFGPNIESVHDDVSNVEIHFPQSLEEYVTLSDIQAVFSKAITTLRTIEQLDKSSTRKTFKNIMVQMAPFMSAVTSNFNTDQIQDEDNGAGEDHLTRLHGVVHSCGYKMYDVSPDGNCCFAAIAFGLLTQQDMIKSKMPSFFDDKQLPLQCSQEELAKVLRKRAVQEWLHNPQEYQGFLTNCNVAEEAPKFLQEGFYHGELANVMVTTMSNLLGIPIVVFSSALHHPIIFITPKVLQVSVPIYVAFLQYGPGHYSGICAADDTADDHSSATTSPLADFKCKCYCGRNDKTGTQEHCEVKNTKYGTTTRCRCLRSKVECTEQCKCQNCKNPYGPRPPSDGAKPNSRRSRKKHSWQKKIDKSAIFAADLKEGLFTGPRTTLEYLVVGEIIQFCIHGGFEFEGGIVAALYSVVVNYTQAMTSTLPLGHKTIQEINKIEREYHHNLEIFENLSITQLKLNVLK